MCPMDIQHMCKNSYVHVVCFSIFILVKKVKKTYMLNNRRLAMLITYTPTTDYHATIKIKQGRVLGTLTENL